MLDKVKLALRLSGTALDGEVSVSTFRRKRDRPVKRWAIPFLIGRLCFMQRRNSASMTTRSVTATHTII